jgi:hypothetical protein
LKDYLNGVICYYDTFHTRSFQLIITISIGKSSITRLRPGQIVQDTPTGKPMRDMCIIRYEPILPIPNHQMQNVYPPTQNIYLTLKVSGSTTQKGTWFGNSIDPYTLFPSSRKLRIQVLFLRVWDRLLGLGHHRVYGSATISLLFPQCSMRSH